MLKEQGAGPLGEDGSVADVSRLGGVLGRYTQTHNSETDALAFDPQTDGFGETGGRRTENSSQLEMRLRH